MLGTAVLKSFPATRRLRRIARNAGDRLLRPESLINNGQTPYDVICDDGLVKLRHYRPQQQRHAVPFVTTNVVWGNVPLKRRLTSSFLISRAKSS